MNQESLIEIITASGLPEIEQQALNDRIKGGEELSAVKEDLISILKDRNEFEQEELEGLKELHTSLKPDIDEINQVAKEAGDEVGTILSQAEAELAQIDIEQADLEKGLNYLEQRALEESLANKTE